RADEGSIVQRVTDDQRLGASDQLVAELVVDRLVSKDALHADATLARLVEGADEQTSESVLEICRFVDDTSGVAAELEHDLLFTGFGLQIPADGRGPREAQQFQSLIVDQGA